MLSQFHPHNAHVSACIICLVGDLKSLLCGFRRERLNLHSTDCRASQSGIRALVSILVVSIRMVIEAAGPQKPVG